MLVSCSLTHGAHVGMLYVCVDVILKITIPLLSAEPRKARLDGDTRALEAEARARARQGARAGATTWCWCPRARPGGRGDAELTTDWTMLESTTRSMDE